MIETDYINGQLLVKRGDEIVKTFIFKDFVSAKQFKPINELRNKLVFWFIKTALRRYRTMILRFVYL